ncbi:MAG: polysaccharide deacetylase family protein [Candidatus Omnitrophota bacterium]
MVIGCGAFFLGGCAHVSLEPSRASLKKKAVPILLYHHIAELPDTASRSQKRWTLSPKKFESQLAWILAHGFTPITLADLIAARTRGKPLPQAPIVLSFDDGWKDQYSGAFPALVKYKFTATFFIITDSVGHSAYMDWGNLENMVAAGMDIEPHSHTHPKLSTVPEKLLPREIIDSKKILEKKINMSAVVFSYPFGSYNDTVISIVKQAGFDAAVTINGLNNGYIFRKDQSYTLVRYPVEGGDNLEQIARTKGFYQ